MASFTPLNVGDYFLERLKYLEELYVSVRERHNAAYDGFPSDLDDSPDTGDQPLIYRENVTVTKNTIGVMQYETDAMLSQYVDDTNYFLDPGDIGPDIPTSSGVLNDLTYNDILGQASFTRKYRSGGTGAIQTAMVIGALPFSIVMALMCIALIKAIYNDGRREAAGVPAVHSEIPGATGNGLSPAE